jgi:hypothetical protein
MLMAARFGRIGGWKLVLQKVQVEQPTRYFSSQRDLPTEYEVGKALLVSGLSQAQVDAMMDLVSILRKESVDGQTSKMNVLVAQLVSKLEHHSDISASDLSNARRISELRHELHDKLNLDYRNLKVEIVQLDSRTANQVAHIETNLELLELRRNSTRELLEKNVEAQLEHMRGDLSMLENRLMRFAVGFGGTCALVGLGIARLLSN